MGVEVFEPKVDARALDRLAARFQAAGANGPQEVKRAMISVRRAMGAETNRAIGAKYNLARKYIASGITVRPAEPLGFTVRGANRPIPAVHYGGRVRKRGGVTVAFFRGKRVLIKEGFAGVPPQGGDPKFWRRTGDPKVKATKGRYKDKRYLREPIDVITGPSHADHLANREVRTRLDGFFGRRLGNEIARRFSRLLKRRIATQNRLT